MRAVLALVLLHAMACVYDESCVEGAERDESGVCRFGAPIDAGDAATDAALDVMSDVAGDVDQDVFDAGPDTFDADISLEFIDVAVGNNHICVLRDDNKLRCRGSNLSGQLGVGDPSAVGWVDPFAFNTAINVRDVSTTRLTTCAVTMNGTLYCWGENDDGEVGTFVDLDADMENDANVFQPTEVGDRNWRSVVVGANSVCALDDENHVKCWGNNSHGQCGVPASATEEPGAAIRNAADEELGATQLAVGDRFACALEVTTGRPHCWGDASNARYRRTGGMAHESVEVDESFFTDISSTSNHTCASNASGVIKCWGANDNLQINDAGGTPLPTIAAITGTTVVAGDGYTCALEGRAASCRGRNDNGQLGRGEMGEPAPTAPVVGIRPLLIDVSSAGQTCALEVDASGETQLHCWGLRDGGPVPTPDQVELPTD